MSFFLLVLAWDPLKWSNVNLITGESLTVDMTCEQFSQKYYISFPDFFIWGIFRGLKRSMYALLHKKRKDVILYNRNLLWPPWSWVPLLQPCIKCLYWEWLETWQLSLDLCFQISKHKSMCSWLLCYHLLLLIDCRFIKCAKKNYCISHLGF